MSRGRTISFNRPKRDALRLAYERAVNGRKESFNVDLPGEKDNPFEFNVGYAKYLLEFLDEQFAQPDQPRQPYNEGEDGQ